MLKGEVTMASEHYQNVVIGSGVAGKCIAWHLAAEGQRTIMIEARRSVAPAPTWPVCRART